MEPTAEMTIPNEAADAPPQRDAQSPAPRRRIAIVGHACSPYLGSEPGFTWKWSTHLARHHDVVCFCHPERRDDIEAELAARPIPNLRFVYVAVDWRFDVWKPDAGERGIRLHYALWQRQVVREVMREHQRQPLDLVHHVSWGSLNQPPVLWKTGLPFVWGPVGGGQTWPTAFIEYAGSALHEHLRRFAVTAARCNPAIIRAARRADLIFATNRETADLVRRAGGRRVEILLDSGMTVVDPAEYPRDRATGVPFTVLWAGRLEPRKGLPLALEAMARLRDRNVRLLVAGDGPQKSQIEQMLDSLQLRDRVTLLGQVPYREMSRLFAESDAFLFTSLRDSMGSVVLEAMSTGLPVIAMDHQGAAIAITDETGIKIPVTTPPDAIGHIAAAIAKLADDPALRQRIRKALFEHAADNTWARRAEKMTGWYEEVLRAHRSV